ncbi:glycosyl hydrolase family 95 catalytic domain-containing protein [Larkinella sp. VNQ87]|uniref:glycosyl hydrolase family 95 catalytic domain-containing protein n=1 Tax=Larkinella sp. VNQ87 TaxID=3400921 RepID=UPI003C056A07
MTYCSWIRRFWPGLLYGFLLISRSLNAQALHPTPYDLRFPQLPNRWDEALPLGNGMLGVLIWQKDQRMRFSLDRADLWDLRPMKGLDRPEFSYRWVEGQVLKKDYKIVQEYFDKPYDQEPGPTKIPGAALEFNSQRWGPVKAARLLIQDAVAEVTWQNGTVLRSFVHATEPVGWFRFDNVPGRFSPKLIPPAYGKSIQKKAENAVVDGDDLVRLGYQQGQVTKQKNRITYRQEGWGGFSYEVTVQWQQQGTSVEGSWTISSDFPNKKNRPTAPPQPLASRTYANDLAAHQSWWQRFWSKSSVQVPDSLLLKQWYLETYKFGATARADAPPISLQAVWTADNGRIPPWKGDYHHDLNTQLSYWPSYSGNHLDESIGYLNHLDENRATYQEYTKRYFGTDGLAVPGVTTLTGKEMGGWIQYSLSPTVSAWLAQHYDLHWRYSQDENFLRQRAYPWVKGVAQHLEQLTVLDENGQRKLPISSSPEIKNNSLQAWFLTNTNYDLALMKFVFKTAAEMATTLGNTADAQHWQTIQNQWGAFALSEQKELMFAASLPYNESHRHFSHVMAIHPLGLIRWEDGETSQQIIRNSLALLDRVGPDWWCGYSYAWLGSLKARAKDGTGAADALRTFASAFCSVNSFHLNGDQTKSGKSKFSYRPFTLEGNFAFAAGLQEMLLQSYAGFIELFPAIPADWQEVGFTDLRAEGAFLVSARRSAGKPDEITVKSEKGGTTRLKFPAGSYLVKTAQQATVELAETGFVKLSLKSGGSVTLQSGH